MSDYLPIRELARFALPYGVREGLFLMMKITFSGGFDDAGSHADSRVVVIGGLVGNIAQWEQLETAWSSKLANPLPGKPRLGRFHLADCNVSQGEFREYRPTERDAVTHDFRKLIIDAGLIGIAAAIDRKAWAELVVGDHRATLGEDIDQCVRFAIEETWRIAQVRPREGDRIALVFDRGMPIKDFKNLTEPYTYPMGVPRLVSCNMVAVADSYPLQAADIVATENYWAALKWLEDPSAPPRAHMRHYLANMIHGGFILDRGAILDLLKNGQPS